MGSASLDEGFWLIFATCSNRDGDGTGIACTNHASKVCSGCHLVQVKSCPQLISLLGIRFLTGAVLFAIVPDQSLGKSQVILQVWSFEAGLEAPVDAGEPFAKLDRSPIEANF